MSASTLIAQAPDAASIGYPALFGGVLLGSIVPVVPTGALVGAAAAVAMTGYLSLPLVVLVSAAGALVGDLVTFAIARAGSEAALRWVVRRQAPERMASARERFVRHGWTIIVTGRLVPAGRIPVLVAAGVLGHPWRRLVPASALACLVWALAYTLLGVVSGGLFDDPFLASAVAAVAVLAVGALSTLVARYVRKRKERM